MRIAVLGLGAMGARMAHKLLAAGYNATVWNRTPAAADALQSRGARAATSPRDAAATCDLAIAMVRDDAASHDVWLHRKWGALGALPGEAVGVDCSTVSIAHAQMLGRAFSAVGRRFLEAPVVGSRPQAEQGALTFLAGGSDADIEAVQPAFDVMGAGVHHCGPAGAGAAMKLSVNAVFGAQVAVLGEALGFARKAGIEATRAADLLRTLPICGPAAQGALMSMATGAFAPAFPIDLVVKDFGLVKETSKSVNADTPMSAAALSVFRTALKKGFGDDNITGVAQLYL